MSSTEKKERFQLWTTHDYIAIIEKMYKSDNCKSRSEFIEKAIAFYVGYITAGDKTNYLPTMFLSNMKSIVADSDNRMSRLLFKLAVELAITQNIVAATNELDEISLERLRGECVKEVKRLNGNFIFEDAIAWQKGN